MPVSPPRPGMPHLNALRAFESAARLNSISAAADELCVTPAAVAQQVKTLEAWTGEKLFKRSAKGVELTPLGAAVLADFSGAFDALVSAVQKLRHTANPHELRIAAMPSIAQLWLPPRLQNIRMRMPNISISVTALEQPPNLNREDFDLAIFYRPRQSSGSHEITLEQDRIFPVCAPAIAAQLTDIADLAHQNFLYDSAWKEDWKTWLEVASPRQNLNKSGPEFSLYAVALEECKNGGGVFIGHEALVRPQINTGHLAVPFNISVPLPRYLTFERKTGATDNPVLHQVIDILTQN